MDKKIIIFLMIILSINSMFLITGLLTKDSATESFYSALPESYQDKVGLGTTDTTLTGGDSEMLRTALESIPFLGGMLAAATPVFQTIDLAGKLSFGYFDVIDRLAPAGSALSFILYIILLPVGIIQVISMGYLFLYILSALSGLRP